MCVHVYTGRLCQHLLQIPSNLIHDSSCTVPAIFTTREIPAIVKFSHLLFAYVFHVLSHVYACVHVCICLYVCVCVCMCVTGENIDIYIGYFENSEVLFQICGVIYHINYARSIIV